MDPLEAEIARPEVVGESQFTGMVLRSRSRESRSKATVRADIHLKDSGFVTRPEPEVARPDIEIVSVTGPSFGDTAEAVISSRSRSVESESEADEEALSGYPFPARQEPEITPIPFHPTTPLRSFT